MIERKIGEVFKCMTGETVMCVKDTSGMCKGCIHVKDKNCRQDKAIGLCSMSMRKDKTSVVFIKVNKHWSSGNSVCIDGYKFLTFSEKSSINKLNLDCKCFDDVCALLGNDTLINLLNNVVIVVPNCDKVNNIINEIGAYNIPIVRRGINWNAICIKGYDASTNQRMDASIMHKVNTFIDMLGELGLEPFNSYFDKDISQFR